MGFATYIKVKCLTKLTRRTGEEKWKCTILSTYTTCEILGDPFKADSDKLKISTTDLKVTS